MGMIGYFAEIDSEKINQLLESTEKPLMDNIHDTDESPNDFGKNH
ncbi:DUF1877 family protein [Escherichia coli]